MGPKILLKKQGPQNSLLFPLILWSTSGLLVYLMESSEPTCVTDGLIYGSAALNCMGKSSTCFVPGAIQDQVDVSLLIHRTESHDTHVGKGQPAARPSSRPGPSFTVSFAVVTLYGMGR